MEHGARCRGNGWHNRGGSFRRAERRFGDRSDGRNADSDTHSDADSFADRNADPDTECDPDSNQHANSCRNAFADSDRNTDTHAERSP